MHFRDQYRPASGITQRLQKMINGEGEQAPTCASERRTDLAGPFADQEDNQERASCEAEDID